MILNPTMTLGFRFHLLARMAGFDSIIPSNVFKTEDASRPGAHER